jgi:hypothetical protein
MKILITGPQWHDNSPMIAAHGFQELGHTVEIYYDNPKHWMEQAARIGARTPFSKKLAFLADRYRDEVGAGLLQKVSEFRPDFVFVIAGFRFSRTVIQKIRDEYNIPVANFVVDDPAFCTRTLLYDLGAYTTVFSIDRSWMPVIEFFNPGRVYPMAHAGDLFNFKPLGLEKQYDLAFGGTVSLRLPNGPSGYLRSELLSALAEENFHIKAFIGGVQSALTEFPELKKIDYFDGYKAHAELNELYNQSKIILGIHSPQLKSGVSPRIFDAAFSGSFSLVEYKPELPELFPDGMRWFKNTAELKSLAKHYLSHDDERENLAKIALEIARERHTFKSRAAYILQHLN